MNKQVLFFALAVAIGFFAGCQVAHSDTFISAPAPSSLSASQPLSDADKIEIKATAKALSGALMLGSSWTEIAGESYKNDLSLTTFYCLMNPNCSNTTLN